MPTTQSLFAVQQVYIAYYGRPADREGLQFWAARLEQAGGDFKQIIAAFAQSPESLALYGANQSDEDLINAIYINLLGRPAEPTGLAFWLGTLASGQFNNRTVILAILQSAQGEDAQLIANKIEVANLFTQALADGDLPYSGTAAAALGRTLLSQVSADDASVTDLSAALPAFLNVVQLASQNPDAFSQFITGGLFNDLSIIRENLQLSELQPAPPVAPPVVIPPVVLPPAPLPPVVFLVTGNGDVAEDVQRAQADVATAEVALSAAVTAQATAQTELNDANTQLEGLNAQLEALNAGLNQAQTEVDVAQAKVQKTELLVGKLNAAAQVLEDANALAQTKLAQAAAQREQALANKDAADSLVLDAQAELDAAGEVLQLANAALAEAQQVVQDATTPGTQESFVIGLSSRSGFTSTDTGVRFSFGEVSVIASFTQNASKGVVVAAIAKAFNDSGLFTAEVTGSPGNPTVTVTWNAVGNQPNPAVSLALLYNTYRIDVAVEEGTAATFPSQLQLDALTVAMQAAEGAQQTELNAQAELADALASAKAAAKALQQATAIEKLAGFAALAAAAAEEKGLELLAKAELLLEELNGELGVAAAELAEVDVLVQAKAAEIAELEGQILELEQVLQAANTDVENANNDLIAANGELETALVAAENTPINYEFSNTNNNIITNFNAAADKLDFDFVTLLEGDGFEGFTVANGIATFTEEAPATSDELIALLLDALGTRTDTVGFVFAGSTFVLQGNGVQGEQSSDVVIQLAGVQLGSLENLIV